MRAKRSSVASAVSIKIRSILYSKVKREKQDQIAFSVFVGARPFGYCAGPCGRVLLEIPEVASAIVALPLGLFPVGSYGNSASVSRILIWQKRKILKCVPRDVLYICVIVFK